MTIAEEICQQSERVEPTVSKTQLGKMRPAWLNQLVFGLLVASVLLKAESPRETMVVIKALGGSLGFFWVILMAETLVAVIVLFELGGKAGHYVSVALFIVFAAISAYMGIAGHRSCGCFGALKIHPGLTAVFDVAVAITLIRFKKDRVSAKTHLFAPVIVAALVLMAANLVWQLGGAPVSARDLTSNDHSRAGSIIVVDSENWGGQPFPLADYIVPRPTFVGSWSVLFFHHECNVCIAEVSKYESLGDAGHDVLLVEVPPHGYRPSKIRSVHFARLDETIDWFVETPLELEVTDGIVTHVEE